VALIRDLSSHQTVATLRGHTSDLFGAEFSPDGKWVVTASQDGTARLWAVPEVRAIHLGRLGDSLLTTAVSGHQLLAVTVDHNGLASVWNLTARSPIARMKAQVGPQLGPIEIVAFSANGNFAVAENRHRVLTVWEVGTWRSIGKLRLGAPSTERTGPDPVDVSNDGNSVVTLSNDDGAARVFDVKTGRRLAELGHPTSFGSPAVVLFSPDGNFVLTTNQDAARIWNVRTGERVAVLPHRSQIMSAAFSADGNFLAAAEYDRTGRVWEARTGRLIVVLRGHTDVVNSAQFGPNAQFVVTASEDRTVKVWETRTGKSVVTLPWDLPSATHASFSSDGRFIFAANYKGTAWIYRCDVCRSRQGLFALARARVARQFAVQEKGR
jgi:WD40 repeat protein